MNDNKLKVEKDNTIEEYNIMTPQLLKKLKKYKKVLYTIIDKKNKNNYKPQLLQKSFYTLSKLLKFDKNAVHFEDLEKLPELLILTIEETPSYILFSYNKEKDIVEIEWYGSGYYLPKK